MEPDKIRPLNESDVDAVIEKAGGVRAHRDTDRRNKPGADYLLGSAVIELKMLDEEGFNKPERQRKLAVLFRNNASNRPVIVLDRSRLSPTDQCSFDRIAEGPIKTDIAKANKQLKQSRVEHPDTNCSVLMIVNNGYTTLNYEELKELVVRRVRNDTREIDAVVVAGVYYHSDGFDSYFMARIECVPIILGKPFMEFEKLQQEWNNFSERFMTDKARGTLGPKLEKGPITDTQFDLEGVTYIRPAPALGSSSDFYFHGRPRTNTSGLFHSSAVGKTWPYLTQEQWEALNNRLGRPADLMESYEVWHVAQIIAENSSDPLIPLVTVPVTVHEWSRWCNARSIPETACSVFDYAKWFFTNEVRARFHNARERLAGMVLPSRYVLVATEVIGQDCANDISHISIIRECGNAEPLVQALVEDARIVHEHALMLGGAYAVRENIDTVLWLKDMTYAWV